MLRQSTRSANCHLGCLALLFFFLSFAPSVTALECSIDYPNTFGINLGHSHSTVSVFHQGAVRLPVKNQITVPIRPNPLDEPELFLSGQESSLQSGLFNTSHKVCHPEEPQYYIAQTFETSIPEPNTTSVAGENFHRSLSVIFRQMRGVAEGWFGDSSSFAVVTVPQAWYSDEVQKAIKTAGEAIGLDIVQVINAPSAAALGHRLDIEPLNDEKVLVYDLGRYAFEATVLDVNYGVINTIQSSRSILDGASSIHQQNPLEYNEPAIKPLFEETISHVEKILADANLTIEDISTVILTGQDAGHSQVLEGLDTFLNPHDTRDIAYYILDYTDDAVAVGTAYQALLMSSETCEEASYLPAILDRALGVGVLGGMTTQMIRRYSAVPLEMTYNFTTTLDNQSDVIIPVLLGGFVSSERNRPMGTLKLAGIPPVPRGEPTISVRIQLDEDSTGDIVLSAHAAYLDKNGREILSDSLVRDNWFGYEDPDLEETIAEERADDLNDYKICTNPAMRFEPNAVVRRDYSQLDQFWTTKVAAREFEEGHFARALCLYEKSLPYFPIGHKEIAAQIRRIRRVFSTDNDDTAVLGADNPFTTPSRTGC
ncbi:heat shock protein [Colletotrichum truncatum]|uniref:Heat shock protein n=1 Tax=Colletotrichum truncatum TaxID=5467 RepID=A0ACC3YD60_COLTU